MGKFTGWKTRIFGVVVLILGVIQEYGREVIPENYQGVVLMAIAVAIIVLREVTSTPTEWARARARAREPDDFDEHIGI
jgi:membrane-bound ClpP family serine protease